MNYCGTDLTRLFRGACGAPDARSAEIWGEQGLRLHREQTQVRDHIAQVLEDDRAAGESGVLSRAELAEWDDLVAYTAAIVYASERRRRQLIEGDPGEGPPALALIPERYR